MNNQPKQVGVICPDEATKTNFEKLFKEKFGSTLENLYSFTFYKSNDPLQEIVPKVLKKNHTHVVAIEFHQGSMNHIQEKLTAANCVTACIFVKKKIIERAMPLDQNISHCKDITEIINHFN